MEPLAPLSRRGAASLGAEHPGKAGAEAPGEAEGEAEEAGKVEWEGPGPGLVRSRTHE